MSGYSGSCDHGTEIILGFGTYNITSYTYGNSWISPSGPYMVEYGGGMYSSPINTGCAGIIHPVETPT